MQILTIHASKGGSGKTTTAATLAAVWGARGLRVLAIDTDPQASLSRWIATPGEGPTLFDVLTRGVPISSAIRPTVAAGVSIVPASRELATLDAALAGKVGNEKRLAKALPRSGFDVVVIDTAPALGLGVVQALMSADFALVTCEPSPLGLEGVRDALGLIADVRDAKDGRLDLAGVLIVRAQSRRSLTAEVDDALRAAYGADVLRATVREAAAVAEAPSHRRGLVEYAPGSAVLDDYERAAKEIGKRIGL